MSTTAPPWDVRPKLCGHGCPEPGAVIEAMWDAIRAVGWGVIGCARAEDRPGWTYTVGLPQTHHHPELVIVGMPASSATVLLHVMGQRIRGGERFTKTGLVVSGVARAHDLVIHVPTRNVRPDDIGYPGVAHVVAGHDVHAVQVLWPDAGGKFPTSPFFEVGLRLFQPIVGTR